MSTSAFRTLGRWAVVFGALVALLAGVVLVGGVDLAVAQDGDAQDDAKVDGFDEVRTDVVIHENGSATFTVDYRYLLGDDNTTEEEWDERKADIEEREEAYLAAEEDRWRDTLADAKNGTEREDMDVYGFDVRTDESSTPREYGHVVFTFEWRSFAYVELNRIEAGDALDGYVLDEGTSLMFAWPASYNATEIEPAPDERRDSVVGWNGAETEFVGGEPSVSLIQNDTGAEGAADEGRAGDGAGVLGSWLTVAGLAGLVLAVLVGSAGWLRWRNGSGASRADGGAEGDRRSEPSGPPPELLSNEERVLRLLEERGGRVKQQEVVSELDWTEAKTSQVVGGLREDDEIEVFRIGRENVLALPADEPEREN